MAKGHESRSWAVSTAGSLPTTWGIGDFSLSRISGFREVREVREAREAREVREVREAEHRLKS